MSLSERISQHAQQTRELAREALREGKPNSDFSATKLAEIARSIDAVALNESQGAQPTAFLRW